ncbi:MAG: hypothetical protein AAFX50_11925, partial [Acidobacteriota bacterium]
MLPAPSRTAAICVLLVWPSGFAAAEPAAPAACVLEAAEVPAGDRLVAAAVETWRWQSRPGDAVRCDLETYEPLDAACPGAPCPGETTLRLLRGRSVEVAGPRPGGAVEVEWRRFGEPGATSRRVARRSVTPPGEPTPWSLVTARAEDRLVRLRVPGRAPETFFLPAPSADEVAGDGAAPRLAPAWPGPGGEIFGFVGVDGFWPTLVRVGGPSEVHELTLDEWGQFDVSGLRAGRYRLRAVFLGGWRIDGPSVLVEDGATAELLPWDLAPNGALELD